jgi:hypothetical protein
MRDHRPGIQSAAMTSTPPPVGHAFISYVHEDAESVDALCEVLEAAGIAVWRDRDQLWPGDEWKIQIRRAIQRSSLAFIACFSKQSIARTRSYQNEELILAVEEYRSRPPGRPWLFPVRFDDIDLPEFELGAGKTLDALQRTDLFGPKREPELTRLAISISRVIAGSPTPSEVLDEPTAISERSGSGGRLGSVSSVSEKSQAYEKHSGDTSNTTRLKVLLREPAKDIELDDYITDTADIARRKCIDTVAFPTSTDAMRSTFSAARFAIERVDQYWRIVAPLAEALAAGCAWGTNDHNPLWSRAMRTIANTTPMEGGQTVLLDMRAYPRILALYAAGLGAVARNKYSALRAVTVDAKYRDRERGRTIPVISVCHPGIPFSNASFIASAVAISAAGNAPTDEVIESIYRRTSGVRRTPASDDLHDRLRETLRPIIRDDDDYSDSFDRLEVLFGVIAEDVAIQVKAAGDYLHGGWVGRYIWRTQYARDIFAEIYEEFRSEGPSWAPLDAGLFDRSLARAEKAFAAMGENVKNTRTRVF